jgi:hypothetical protein
MHADLPTIEDSRRLFYELGRQAATWDTFKLYKDRRGQSDAERVVSYGCQKSMLME